MSDDEFIYDDDDDWYWYEEDNMGLGVYSNHVSVNEAPLTWLSHRMN
jgi:hypothetical protein